MATIPNPSKTQDLEVKDAQLIFNSVWQKLESKHGLEKLRFPKELTWLNGAPGSGKGTQTRFIMQFRDLTDGPVVVSDLLTSPVAQRMKDAGRMVGDKEVLSLVLEELLDPKYQSGTVIDGFPRTKVQVDCLKLLYYKLRDLRTRFYQTDLQQFFPKPIFHIMVLFVDEGESVARQLYRGKLAKEHNEEVLASGVGKLWDERVTDFDEDAARRRYRTFKEGTYEALKELRQIFHYHFINAQGTIEEVQERIEREMRYQSSLELDEKTFDQLRGIPTADEIVRHARQDLVTRLDEYSEKHEHLLEELVTIVNDRFMPIIIRHAISGMAMINAEDEIFHDPLALQILLDIFSERGYHTSIDVRKLEFPSKVDLQTGKIELETKRIYSFWIRFQGSEIRRG